MRILGLFLTATLLASGAMSLTAQNITIEAANALKGRSITYIVHKKPDFTAMTSGKAAFALFGAFAMISAGNKIVQENDIQDPALSISENLVNRFQKTHQMQIVPASPDAIDVKGVDRVLERCPGADYVLDIQTNNWSFTYFPTDWSHYRVIYSAKATLIDARTKTVVASGKVSRTPEKSPDSPTKDELLASSSARLKDELKKHSFNCEEELATKVFQLPERSAEPSATAKAETAEQAQLPASQSSLPSAEPTPANP